MGIRFGAKWFMALLVGAVMFSCSDDALMEAPQVMEQDEQKEVATLIAGFTKEDTESRLAYEIQKNGGIKMTWADGDNLTATPAPSDESWAYTFTLSKGAGTNTGTFTCSEKISGSLPQDKTTNGWTVYYPGSIKGEQDWFDKSYEGQKQVGDNDISHLKDYHSIRLAINGMVSFQDTYIDFSGDNVDESKCMKFNLSGFESSKPAKIELMYMNSNGVYESCFHKYNYIDGILGTDNLYWSNTRPHNETTSLMTLDLEGFTSNVTKLTAYMMMSNYPVEVEKGGKFRVYLTTTDSKKYYCDVAINNDVTLEGSHLYSITCNKWTSVTNGVDGMTDANGIVVLQEATKGNPGTDIIIMGDGFAADKFTAGGEYETAMRKAYNDFFSIEPYRSLKDYFNVYYINAVSEDDHDADPKGLANGAYQGNANTVFNTQFSVDETTITGNDAMALEYAKQAIRTRGGKGGTAVTNENEITTRSNTALIMVMVNVYAHAGTCTVVWSNGYDYGKAYSVAYTALGNDRTGMGSKWTTIHEAGGHGFGKLADEYGGYVYSDPNSFGDTYNDEWKDLDDQHACGVSRNADKYWGSEEVERYGNPAWGVTTTEDNVYWSALLNATYAYKTKEGLSFYRGANAMSELFCRPTDNSVMRDQFATNGHFFNAPSRWAIWYRLMRLTNSITATKFEDSLNEFITFDQNLTITLNDPSVLSRSAEAPQDYKPLAPPVLIKGEWINDRLVLEK